MPRSIPPELLNQVEYHERWLKTFPHMHSILSPEMEQEVIERYGEVGKTLAYYL